MTISKTTRARCRGSRWCPRQRRACLADLAKRVLQQRWAFHDLFYRSLLHLLPLRSRDAAHGREPLLEDVGGPEAGGGAIIGIGGEDSSRERETRA
ncbi:hypothetical protein NL676_030737 [Syzygium grande]|nr:hypothetical protein NL676_030737 [Syzygium grande]